MLCVKNEEHFNKVLGEAKQLGLDADLQKQLDYLANYACNDDEEGADRTCCELWYDFAPLSFSFVMKRKTFDDGIVVTYEPWFNGGLIWYPGRTGTDQSLSVELCPSDKPHWSVHT